MTDQLVFASAQARDDLGRFASRARSLDADGAMRLQAVGSVLAAWVGVLDGRGILGEGAVLGLRTMALATPATADVIVPLAAVTDRTARGNDAVFDLPPTRALAAWTAITPPRAGWEPVGTVDADDLAEAGQQGIAEVSEAIETRGAAAGLVRDAVWSRTIAESSEGGPELSAGAALGALSLGFLTPGAQVALARHGSWLRLTCPGGFILCR